jgi:diguanylate cyclase (GGDEF)-like protein
MTSLASLPRKEFFKKQIALGLAVCTGSVAVSVLATYLLTFDWPSNMRTEAFWTSFAIPALVAPVATFFVQRLLVRNHSLLLEVERLANYDELTSLLNRRAFMRLSMDRLEADARPAVMLGDIDHFKRVNDTYGHAAGDEALRHVSKILNEHGPSQGIVARLGGEEFVVLFHWETLASARQTAETIRSALEATPFQYDNKRIPLTISIGLVIGNEKDTIDKLLLRADSALYRAKDAGRNQTLLAA